MSKRFRLAEVKIAPDGTVEDAGRGRFLIETESGARLVLDSPRHRYRREPAPSSEVLAGDGRWAHVRGHSPIRIGARLTMYLSDLAVYVSSPVVAVWRIVGAIDDGDRA